MKNFKLIAFDLDNTLLADDKSIPAENLAALKKAGDAGILTVPATGRILPALPKELVSLPGARFAILANGAAIYDLCGQKVLGSAEIPAETALRVFSFLEGNDLIYDCYIDNWGYMSLRYYRRIDEYVSIPGIRDLLYSMRTPVPDLSEFVRRRGRSVQKIQMYFRAMDERSRKMALLEETFPELAVSSSVYNNIELNIKAASKGQALKALCSRSCIDIKDTLAFGDSVNDCDMLSTAGRGVAMANAGEEVKSCADAVTQSNNDCGVARELERLGIV